MKRLSTFLLAVALALPASGADTSAITNAVNLLRSSKSSFEQRFLPRGYKNEQIETGTVVFGAAPASRWTYETPELKTFVFDGVTSWMYVPADESVMVHEVTAAEKQRLPFFVLSDPGKMTEWYDIAARNGKTTLTARGDEQLLRTIEIAFDASGRLASLGYTDAQGNRTTFVFSGWSKTTTNAETFTFTPPPGVEVIEN